MRRFLLGAVGLALFSPWFGLPSLAAGPASFTGAPAAGTYEIHVVDTGTGLATIIEGSDFIAVYDDGSNDAGATDRLIPYLKVIRPDVSTLDHVILSHPHTDHVLFLPKVFDAYKVKNFWDSGRVYNACGYRILLWKIAGDPSIKYHDAIAGSGTHTAKFTGDNCKGKPPATIKIPQSTEIGTDPVDLGAGATMTFLYHNAGGTGNPNTNSVVVLFTLGQTKALFMGDAEGGGRADPSTAPTKSSIEGKLLACCAADLAADILIVGHHGSETSSRTAFLDAVGAKYFVVSSGPKPYSGTTLPDKVVINELTSRGELHRTDVGDGKCMKNAHKIGADKDNQAAGCTNVVLVIGKNGSVSANEWSPED